MDFTAMKSMQLGQVLDYCIENINQQNKAESKAEKPRKRKATQADIDAFFGAPRKG